MDNVLEIRGLRVAFGQTVAVRGLDLSVRSGETLALVGESGSGKSATALALMRLLPQAARIQSGQAFFGDIDLLQAGQAALRKLRGKALSMIFQEPMTSLNPVMPIGEQIAEVLRQHESLSRKQARQRATELLDLVRIAEPDRRYKDYAHNLSGGMRQRVMIAIAVAGNPRLLIADEPTTALDVTIQAQVLDLIDRLRRELSMAVLLITHDLSVVAQWADRVAVMYAGEIVEQASAVKLFHKPGAFHPYTRGLLKSTISDAPGSHYRNAPLYEIPGVAASAVDESGCRFAPRCALALDSCRKTPPLPELISPGHLVSCPVVQPRKHQNSSPSSAVTHGNHDAFALR
nr:ABC transporter ATP-binding protein [Pollutimonas bauzanensis]